MYIYMYIYIYVYICIYIYVYIYYQPDIQPGLGTMELNLHAVNELNLPCIFAEWKKHPINVIVVIVKFPGNFRIFCNKNMTTNIRGQQWFLQV